MATTVYETGICGTDCTREHKRLKLHRTLGELAYVNSLTVNFAKLIALVCGGLNAVVRRL